MAFTFDQIFAADPANPSNVAQNASITIFAPGDGTMTPLTITDPDGQPLANPVPVNANGFGSAFAHATLDRVAWQGGGFTGFFTSYEGMKNEAVAARAAAESAASTAGADAAAVADAAVASVIADADAAASAAANAEFNANAAAASAASAAALVGAPADAAIAAAINGTGDTRGALDAIYAKPLANTFVMAGDSITEAAGANGGRTFWAHAVNFSKRKIKVVYNAGIGGNSTAQLVARFDADVLSKGSDWVHILIGRNDLADTADGGYTPVTTGITTLLDMCRDAGKKVVVGTIIPSLALTANQTSGQQRINQWIRDLPTTRPVIVADYNAALTNPADGLPITGLLYDNTHPGVGGAARMGRLLAESVEPFLSPTSVLLNSETDVKQLLTRGRFSVGGAGAVPSQWFETAGVGGARTYSKVARTDGVNGSWQRVVVPTDASVMLASNVNIGATLAIGDTVNFRIEYKASAAQVMTTGQYLFASLSCYNGSTFSNEVFDCQYGAGGENVLGFDRSGVFKTKDLVIPAGTTLIQARVQIGGGVTLDLDRASVQKV